MLNFNGIDIPNFVKVQKIDMQVLPAISFDTIQQKYGTILSKSKLGGKTIKVSITIVPNNEYPTLTACIRELAVWCAGDNFKDSKLIISDDADIYYMGRVSNIVDISDLLFAGTGEIDFIIPSGLASAVTGINIATTGGGTTTIEYKGTAPAPVVITCKTTSDFSTDVEFTSDTGQVYKIIGDFKTGDIVTIDTGADVVKINDKLALSVIGLESETIYLHTGTNTINCNDMFFDMTITAPINYR